MSEPHSAADPGASRRKLITEFGPVILFFIAYRMFDLMVATGVLMLSCTIAVLYSRTKDRRWPVAPLITAVIVLIMGSLTLILQDKTFIKMKPTIVNGLFAATLLGGLACGQLFIKKVLGEALPLDDRGWRKLTIAFVLIFAFLAVLNEILWRSLSEPNWVTVKTFGYPVLMVVFFIGLSPLLKAHMLEAEEPAA
jgi:intracellular septation protein